MDVQSLERPVVVEALARIAEESSRLMVHSASGEGSLRLLSLVGLKRLSFPLPTISLELEALLRFLEDLCLKTYSSESDSSWGSDSEPASKPYPKLCAIARIQRGIADNKLQSSIQQAIECDFAVRLDALIDRACASRDRSLAEQVPPSTTQKQIDDALDYLDRPVSGGRKRRSGESETNRPSKRRRNSEGSATLVPQHSLPSEKVSQREENVLWSALNPQILCHALQPQENHLRNFHLRLDDPRVPPNPEGTWIYEAIFSASMPEGTNHGCTKGGTKCYHEAEFNVTSRAEMSPRIQSEKGVERVSEGKLCKKYISPSHGRRLCLLCSESKDGKPILYATAGTFKALEAHVLEDNSHLSNARRHTWIAGSREAPRPLELDVGRMSFHDKIFLSYVVGRSVNQYYNTRLTTQQLWTLQSLSTISDTEGPQDTHVRPATETANGLSLFSYRHPYVSVNFKTEYELGKTFNIKLGMDFHQNHGGARFYPGPISLGLLLLDIWENLSLTNELTWSEAHMLRAQYAGYARSQYKGHQQIQQAIVSCLDVNLFAGNLDKTNTRVTEKRDWLLRNVVHPLRLLYLSAFHSGTLALPSFHVGQTSYPDHGDVSISAKISQYKSFINFLEKPKGIKKEAANDGVEWISEFLDVSGDVHERVKEMGKQPKICILDTGCDPDCNFFKEERLGDPNDLQRIIWRDFTTPESSDRIDQDGGEAGNFRTRGKHGTNIASLLLMLLPRANIYVARIAPDRGDMVNLETYDGVLDSIKRAIRHAANVWMVDIISMSFGYITEPIILKVAIEDAIRDRRNGLLHPKLIMLAAASNDGGLSPELAPACWPEVIAVRGTTSRGHFPVEYNPNESKSLPPHFGTIAQGVPCGYGFRWGTSFAAPILAATAGLVQLFVSCLIHEEVKLGNIDRANLYSRVYETEGMRQILAAFTAKGSGGDGTRAVKPQSWGSLQNWEGTIWHALAQMKTPG
ncbi:hypothetical protein FANTH_9185 [Fusarium anthophilum]|uniref:Peptidase S8/S53 domain-containing protein n=1 Tax=Fusarium anthophilum TaxID=48485 RepID=A0A8H5DZ40_9HYPO|nr:hypothetical protein FANTH_9185 [Fusarium anthophilum]